MPGSGTGSRRLGAGRILIVGGAAISGRRGGSRGRSWRRGGGREGGEAFVQGGGADAAGAAQRGEGHGAVAVGQCCGDAFVERAWARSGGLSTCRSLGRVDGLQSEGGPVLGQRDGDWGERRCGAMLDGEGEVIAVAAQIEVGIAPGVELGRATQGLSGAGVAGGFPGMMDNQHGNAMAALELAQ